MSVCYEAGIMFRTVRITVPDTVVASDPGSEAQRQTPKLCKRFKTGFVTVRASARINDIVGANSPRELSLFLSIYSVYLAIYRWSHCFSTPYS